MSDDRPTWRDVLIIAVIFLLLGPFIFHMWASVFSAIFGGCS